MRILVTAVGKDLDSPFSFSFGRSPYFLIVDTDTMKVIEVLENPGYSLPRGAGIAAANLAASKSKVILTGNVGPNAYQVLSSFGVQMFSVNARTVKEAVELYKNGKAIPIVGPRGGFGRGRGWRGGRGWWM